MLTLQEKPQTTCSSCPLWQRSPRTPNVGHCPYYKERTMGHDKAGHNCPTSLNTYKVDLFLGVDIIDVVTVQATSIKEVDRQMIALGEKRWDFDSWGTPRRVRRR